MKRLNIEDFRFHDLRHCFATYTMLNGGNLIDLKETLGHTDISMTARYSKAMLEGMRKLVDGFKVNEKECEMIIISKKVVEKQ